MICLLTLLLVVISNLWNSKTFPMVTFRIKQRVLSNRDAAGIGGWCLKEGYASISILVQLSLGYDQISN